MFIVKFSFTIVLKFRVAQDTHFIWYVPSTRLHQAQMARQIPARQIPTRHSQMKKLSGFMHQKFAEKLKEDGQIVPDSARIYQIKI